MAPAKVKVIHAQRRGTAQVEHSNFEPLWRLRNTTTGKPIRAIRLRDVTAIEVSILKSERVVLALVTAKRRHVFISTKPADANWDAVLADLRAATRGQFEKFRASSLRRFPPIEYLRGPPGDLPPVKKQPLSLLDLPQELLDIIFGLAYPAQEGFVINCRDGWQYAERHQSRRSGTAIAVREFVPKVCDFMVSKRFFQEAAKAWVANQNFRDRHFALGSGSQIMILLLRNRQKPVETDILMRYITTLSIKCTSVLVGCASILKSLRELNMMVYEDTFKSVKPRFPWKEALREKQFKIIFEKLGFSRIRGLKKFTLVSGRVHSPRSGEEKQKWEEDVAALQSFLLPFVTRPKESKSAGTKCGDADEGDAGMSGQLSRPGVIISKGALVLLPDSLRAKKLKKTQAFIGQNSEAIISKIEKLRVDEDLASLFTALTI